MSGVEIALAIVLGLVVNEFTDVSPWLARKLVVWSAHLRYGDTPRSEIRAEELTAVINDRPGKLFKLGTGVRFAFAALAMRLRRLVSGESQPADETLSEAMPRSLLTEEPSDSVSRYLFPTERYRGEWRRHWIHLAKSLGVISLYAVFGVWAAALRIDPRFAGWTIVAIIAAALLLAAWRVLGWYFARFVITNKRLMSTEGVVFRRVAMIPLIRVTDLRYVQSPLARLLDYGTFKLESANRRNAMRKIVDLPNPNELYLRLVEEMYEPAAVESRLGRSLDDHTTPEPRVADAVRLQTEIIHHIEALSTRLAHLAAVFNELDPAALQSRAARRDPAAVTEGSEVEEPTAVTEEPAATPTGAAPHADSSASPPASVQDRWHRVIRPRAGTSQPQSVE